MPCAGGGGPLSSDEEDNVFSNPCAAGLSATLNVSWWRCCHLGAHRGGRREPPFQLSGGTMGEEGCGSDDDTLLEIPPAKKLRLPGSAEHLAKDYLDSVVAY